MKNKILSFVGSRLEGRKGNTQRTSNLSPTNHQRYHRTWGAIFTLVMLFTFAIGNVWGDETFTISWSSAGTPGYCYSQAGPTGGTLLKNNAIYFMSNQSSNPGVTTISSKKYLNPQKLGIVFQPKQDVILSMNIGQTNVSRKCTLYVDAIKDTVYTAFKNTAGINTRMPAKILDLCGDDHDSKLWWHNNANQKVIKVTVKTAGTTYAAGTDDGSIACLSGATAPDASGYSLGTRQSGTKVTSWSAANTFDDFAVDLGSGDFVFKANTCYRIYIKQSSNTDVALKSLTFTPVSSTLTLNPNEGTFDTEGWTNNNNGTWSKTVTNGNVTLPTVTKAHYHGGWNVSGNTVTSVNVSANTTVSAVWAIDTYTVNFLNQDNSVFATEENVEWDKTVSAPATDPEAVGYTFDGWDFDFSTHITANTNIASKWLDAGVTYYTVTLNYDNGSANGSESVEDGTAFAQPADPSKTGYTFLKWVNADTEADYDFSASVTEDITLKAIYTINKYTVNFLNKDASVYATELEVPYNTTVSAPATSPTAEHYTFAGWDFDFNTPITDNTDIASLWTAEQETLTFNSNGGSAVADQNVDYNTVIAAPVSTRTNWTLEGWTLDPSADPVVLFDFSTPITSDLDFTAVWSRNEISSTPTDIVLVSTSAAIGSTSPLTGVYYGNAEWTYTGNAKISTGGAMFGTPNAKKWVGFTLPSGYTATVTANSTSSNDRYCVLVTEADRAGDAGSATKYLNIHVNESGKQTQTSSQIGAGSYALGSTSGGIDINSVVVHVSEAPIMVTFKTGEATYAAITATSGEKLGNLFLNGALPTPVVAGYTFNGWKNGENDATENDEITASMTITADMTPVTYNLTLSAGNGALTAGAAKIQIGASAMTDITTTTGTGVLVGYFTTADGDVKVAESNGTLVAGDVEGFVANGKWNRASDAELFAQYLASYNVKFYPGYGENAQIGSTQEVLKNGKAVAPADPEREGYEFLGWSTDGTAAYIQAVASYAITVATDFTAVWKQKFTVTYYDGATKLGEETVLAGESPVEAGNYDDKALSTFAGWYNNSNLAEEHKIINVAELVINDNTSIYGKWNKDYATSVNLKAEAASTEDPKPTYEEVLAAHNISGALTSTSWDTGTDIYNGLKIKGKDSYITFYLKQGQFIVMTVGYANNDVKIEVNETEQSFTSSTSALSYFRYYAESADALIKVTKTANNGTASSIRDIYISDPIVVTYNANGGDAVAAANYTGTALTLPSATKGTDSFLGWFDAADGGNKIGEANDEYTPTADIELFAHWEAVSSDARLASISFSSAAGTLSPAFDPEVTVYTYTMPYGTAAIPTITGATSVNANAQAPIIGDAATAWGEAQTIKGVAESGDKKTYTITMLQAPKDGVAIISIDVPTGNGNVQTIAADNISGFIGGTATQKLQSGGTKLGGTGNYIGFTLANSETLKAGDVIRLNVTATNGASHLTLYQDASTANLVKDINWTATTGVNLIPVPAEAVGLSTLYIYRTSSACNPTLSEFAILRPMDPVMTAITIDGRAGVIDEANKTVAVTIPYEADLAALNVEPTIVWNAPAAENSIVVNDGSAWILGDNTYKLTDKDNDYTEYTITLTRDVKKYTVTFDAQGGSTVQSELVVAGEKLAAAPADPTREDYLFLGWAETADGEVVDVTDFVINADKEFYAQWKYENPIVILDENGDIDDDNFFTGMDKGTVNFGGADHNCISFSSTASTIVGATGSNKFIVYNAKTTQTRIKFVLYNTQSSAKNIVLQKVAEGETAPTNVVIEVPSQQQFTTEYYAYNSDANRSMYVYTENTGIKVLQVKVIESGTPIHQAGQAGYVLNLNKGRVFAPSNEDVEFEGLSMKVSSNYKVLNSEVLQTENNLSFKVDELVTMTLVSTGAKYKVSKDPAGSGSEYGQGTNKHILTPGTWYIVSSTGSNIKFTNISFSEPVADHSRPNLNPNNIGTLCWTNNAILGGATLYELAGKNENNYLVFDEVEENRLEAGKPYIFVPENGNTEIKVYNTDTEDALTQGDLQAVNGMHGTFVDLSSADGVTLWGNYVISKNHYIYVDSDNVTLKKYRAYITSLDDVAPANQEPAPTQNGAPRRRLVMGGNAPAVATDIDNIFDNDTKVQKVLINGQLFIIRGAKTYDATGRFVK